MVFIVNVFFLLVGLLLSSPPRVQPFFPTAQRFFKVVTQKSALRQRVVARNSLNKPLRTTVITQTAVAFVVNAVDTDRTLFYHRVAARSLGEGSFALAEIACTIKIGCASPVRH